MQIDLFPTEPRRPAPTNLSTPELLDRIDAYNSHMEAAMLSTSPPSRAADALDPGEKTYSESLFAELTDRVCADFPDPDFWETTRDLYLTHNPAEAQLLAWFDRQRTPTPR